MAVGRGLSGQLAEGSDGSWQRAQWAFGRQLSVGFLAWLDS